MAMSFFVSLLFLLSSGDVGAPRENGKPIRLPEVRGVIAAPVRFSDKASQKIADAGLALLASCHHAHHPNEGPMPDWDDILLDCMNKKVYLHIRLPEPREVRITREKVRVSEIII